MATQTIQYNIDLNTGNSLKTLGDVEKELEKNNFEVVKIDLSEFLKAGGSAKCLTLKLIDTVVSVPDND